MAPVQPLRDKERLNSVVSRSRLRGFAVHSDGQVIKDFDQF
jgi:hypothetical protein